MEYVLHAGFVLPKPIQGNFKPGPSMRPLSRQLFQLSAGALSRSVPYDFIMKSVSIPLLAVRARESIWACSKSRLSPAACAVLVARILTAIGCGPHCSRPPARGCKPPCRPIPRPQRAAAGPSPPASASAAAPGQRRRGRAGCRTVPRSGINALQRARRSGPAPQQCAAAGPPASAAAADPRPAAAGHCAVPRRGRNARR
jgi:hypothetical protein